jgi:ligand-binding SRPBCC domain-containing protein
LTILTTIRAPIEICFDLARSIDLHVESMKQTGERAVAGVTRGLIGLGEEVTWEATHFLMRRRLTSRITVFDPPRHFRDSQVRGIFRRFDHDHLFEQQRDATLMTDIFDYESPCGFFGEMADLVLVEGHMRRLIEQRASVIKAAAEAGDRSR